MFKFKEYHWRYLNIRLVLYIIILCIAGVIFVKSASINTGDDTANKQLMGIIIGGVLFILITLIDYHFILKFYWLVYLICIGLLAAVRFSPFGANYNNAQRWLEFGSSLSIQPAEFCKIGLVVVFAKFLELRTDKGKMNSPVTILLLAVAAVIPMVFVVNQPDLSTTLVIMFSLLCVIYVAKISYKWIAGVVAAMIPVGIWFIYAIQQPGQTLVKEYWLTRIMSWLNPEAYASTGSTYQSDNSIMAIGSGGLNGKGLFNTTLESVKNGNFLVEQDTDFIFAVIGEETGFIGSCLIIGVLFLLVAECIYIAIRAKDLSGRLICTGIAAIIAFQSFVNIGVATGLIPNTGIPLPFISAGLSSMISVFIAMGLVMNVALQRIYEK